MFSRQKPSQSATDDDDMDNDSYIRALHNPEFHVFDSTPFDEQCDYNVYTLPQVASGFEESDAPPGISWEYPQDGEDVDVDAKADDPPPPGVTPSMEEMMTDCSMSDSVGDNGSKAASKSASIRSVNKSGKNKSLDEMSVFTYNSFGVGTDTDKSGGARSDTRSSAKYNGGAKSPDRSTRSGRSSIKSTQSNLTSQQADEAYGQICGEYHPSSSPGARSGSKASGTTGSSTSPGTGRSSTPASYTLGSLASASQASSALWSASASPDRSAASSRRSATAASRSRTATPTSDSGAGAPRRAATPATPASLTSRGTHQTRETHGTRASVAAAMDRGRARADTITTAGGTASVCNSLPEQRAAAAVPGRAKAMSFGADSIYSAAVTEVLSPGKEEEEEYDAEDEDVWAEAVRQQELVNEEEAIAQGLKKLEKRTELRDKLLVEETKKEEANETIKTLDGKQDESDGNHDVMLLAKLMSRSGTLDNKTVVSVSLPSSQVKPQVSPQDVLGEMKQDSEPKKHQAPAKQDAPEEDAPNHHQATKEEAAVKSGNTKSNTKDTTAKDTKDSSHGSRGKFAFAKLKSKRFFGGKSKKLKTDKEHMEYLGDIPTEEENEAFACVHVAEVQGESEIELTYGPSKSVVVLDDPAQITEAKEAKRSSSDKITLSAIVRGFEDDEPFTVANVFNKKAYTEEFPRVESNRTDNTEKITIESKDDDAPLNVVVRGDKEEALPLNVALVDDDDDDETYLSDARNGVETGKSTSHEEVNGADGIFGKWFACGATGVAAFQCNDNGAANNPSIATRSLADNTSIVSPYYDDSDIDEAMNVEIFEDADNVIRIGTPGPTVVPEAVDDAAVAAATTADSQQKNQQPAAEQAPTTSKKSQVNSNITGSQVQSKVILKTHVVPGFELLPGEEGKDDVMIVDSVSMKIDGIAHKLEKRREGKDNSGGALKGKRTGLRMKLMKRLSKKDTSSATAIGHAESTDSSAAIRGKKEKQRKKKNNNALDQLEVTHEMEEPNKDAGKMTLANAANKAELEEQKEMAKAEIACGSGVADGGKDLD